MDSVSGSSCGSFREEDVDDEAEEVCFTFAVPFTTSRNLERNNTHLSKFKSIARPTVGI